MFLKKKQTCIILLKFILLKRHYELKAVESIVRNLVNYTKCFGFMNFIYTLREEIFARRNFRGRYFRELRSRKLRISRKKFSRINGIRLISRKKFSRMKDFLEFFRDKNISEYRLILLNSKQNSDSSLHAS